jgi:hypothetical protein
MATVLGCTTEEQRSDVLFFVGKKLNAMDFRKELFPVYGGKCFSHKSVPPWW